MAPVTHTNQRDFFRQSHHQPPPTSATIRPHQITGTRDSFLPARSSILVRLLTGTGAGFVGLVLDATSSFAFTPSRSRAEYLGLHVVRVSVASDVGSRTSVCFGVTMSCCVMR